MKRDVLPPLLLAITLLSVLCTTAQGQSFTFSGTITSVSPPPISPSDANGIRVGQSFSITFTFPGAYPQSICDVPGHYNIFGCMVGNLTHPVTGQIGPATVGVNPQSVGYSYRSTVNDGGVPSKDSVQISSEPFGAFLLGGSIPVAISLFVQKPTPWLWDGFGGHCCPPDFPLVPSSIPNDATGTISISSADVRFPYRIFGTVNPICDLSVTASSSSKRIGDFLTYTLTSANNSQHDATSISLTNTLPAGVEYVFATSSQGTCTLGSGQTVTCNVGTLSRAAPITTAIVVIPKGAGRTLTDRATLSGGNSCQATTTNDTVVKPRKAPDLLAPFDLTVVSPVPTFRAKAPSSDDDANVVIQFEVVEANTQTSRFKSGNIHIDNVGTATTHVPFSQSLMPATYTWRARVVDLSVNNGEGEWSDPSRTFTQNGGIDVSASQSGDWLGLKNAGWTFAVADAFGGQGYFPAQENLIRAYQAGMRVAAYCLLNFSDTSKNGYWQVQQALKSVGLMRSYLAFMAIDVEVPTNGNVGSMTPAQRLARIREAIDAVQKAGLRPIIYTSRGAWDALTGNSVDPMIASVPLWDARYRDTNNGTDVWDNEETHDTATDRTWTSGNTGDWPFAWVSYGGMTRNGKQFARWQNQGDPRNSPTSVELNTRFNIQADANVMSPALLAGGPVVSTPADVTFAMLVTSSGWRYDRTTRRYVKTLTITNLGSLPVTGPLSVVLENLSGNATLYKRTGVTARNYPYNSPYIDTSTVSSNILVPGASVSVTIECDNPTNQNITYDAISILAGLGER